MMFHVEGVDMFSLDLNGAHWPDAFGQLPMKRAQRLADGAETVGLDAGGSAPSANLQMVQSEMCWFFVQSHLWKATTVYEI